MTSQQQPHILARGRCALIQAMQRRKMTQVQLCTALDDVTCQWGVRTGRMAVNHLIHGRRLANLPMALAIEKVLGIPASWWLERTQPTRRANAVRRSVPTSTGARVS